MCVLVILDSETVSLTVSESRSAIREQELRGEKKGFHFCVFTVRTNRSRRFRGALYQRMQHEAPRCKLHRSNLRSPLSREQFSHSN